MLMHCFLNVYFHIVNRIIVTAVLSFLFFLHRTQSWRRSLEGLLLSWLKRASLVRYEQAQTESAPEFCKSSAEIMC